MGTRQDLELQLRERGLRVTDQRVAVLEFLASSPRHPTAEDIGAAVNRLVPRASRASIYNVLHSLKKAGLIEELVFDDAVGRYDANLRRHHHFVCRSCHAVEDVMWEAFSSGPRRRLPDGRTVEGYSVTLRGLCPSCVKS
jgi:Fur family peroxide stress response transcriptional regulator